MSANPADPAVSEGQEQIERVSRRVSALEAIAAKHGGENLRLHFGVSIRDYKTLLAALRAAQEAQAQLQQENLRLRTALAALVAETEECDNPRDDGVRSTDGVMVKARTALRPVPTEEQ